MVAVAAVVAFVGGVATIAAPPGPIDGEAIPSNFGAGKLVATQLNVTGYGNQTVSFGGLTVGSELDQLFLAKSGADLKLAISGNWNTSDADNHVIIFIGTPNHTGQTELMAQGVGGPPFRVQELSQVYVLNTNGTPGNTADDTCDFSSNGVTLPCEADFALGIDTFGGNLSVSLYTLNTTAGGTAECGSAGGPTYQTFASRQFVTQTTLANTNGQATNPQSLGFDTVGMDNGNVVGVTDTDASPAATANTGLEMTIPLSALNLTGNETITMHVLMTGGGQGGYISNQGFPTDPDCNTPGKRPNLSALGRSCLSVNLATLPTFTGGAADSDGQIVKAQYGTTPVATEACFTDFGDQKPDPNAVVLTGGSELDQMFVTNDSNNLYVGITGNLERNGNGLILFVEAGHAGGQGGNDRLSYTGGGRVQGMSSNNGVVGANGSFLPLTKGPNGVINIGGSGDDAILDGYDYAFEMNGSGTPAPGRFYVDRRDLLTNTSTFYGQNDVNSNGSFTTNGVVGTIDFQFAYNYFNSVGVVGGEGDALTQAQVAADAATATTGVEFQIPLSAIGLTVGDLPRNIEVWAVITNGGGEWISNQALPSLRDPTGTTTPADSYSNLDLGPHDYSADGPAGGTPDTQKSSYARTATVTLSALAGCVNADVNCDGSVNGGDILAVRAPGTWNTASTNRPDVNNDGQVNGGDILAIRAPGTWNTSTGPCSCGP
jgi:hypothetical protein